MQIIETIESVYVRKEFKSHRIGLGHQHGRGFIDWVPGQTGAERLAL